MLLECEKVQSTVTDERIRLKDEGLFEPKKRVLYAKAILCSIHTAVSLPTTCPDCATDTCRRFAAKIEDKGLIWDFQTRYCHIAISHSTDFGGKLQRLRSKSMGSQVLGSE